MCFSAFTPILYVYVPFYKALYKLWVSCYIKSGAWNTAASLIVLV